MHRQIQQSGLSTAPTDAKTRSVLFVEQTKDGVLAKKLREVVARLEGILGFRIKIVERAGTSLKNLLPNTNPWSGSHCSRKECITCNQGAGELPDCTRRSVVYENVCLSCNPEAIKKGELKTWNTTSQSLYIGETSRSIQERAFEHHEGMRKHHEDNHMYKHWVLQHRGEEMPKFVTELHCIFRWGRKSELQQGELRGQF